MRKLCVAVPGNGEALGGLAPPMVGDAQVVVFVTPISNSSTLRGHQVLLLGSQEQLTVSCSDCTVSSEVFLSSAECFQGLATANVSFFTTEAVRLTAKASHEWLALFDVSALKPGRAYRLCRGAQA